MQRRFKRFPEVEALLEAAASAANNGASDSAIICPIICSSRDSDHGTLPIPIIPHPLPITRTKSPCCRVQCSPVTQVNCYTVDMFTPTQEFLIVILDFIEFDMFQLIAKTTLFRRRTMFHRIGTNSVVAISARAVDRQIMSGFHLVDRRRLGI